MEPQKEIQQLTKELEHAGFLYYVKDAPEMSDYDYDHKLRRLEELEAQCRVHVAQWKSTMRASKQLRDAIIETLGNLQRLSGPDAAKYAGIPTGFRYLDAVLTGLGRSDLIILAARPGMGKTSFALNIATNVAKQQKVPVAVFSLEMTCEQLADRILSSEAGVDSQAFRTGRLSGEDWRDLAHASDVLCDAPIFIDDSSGLSVAEMKAKIRQLNQDPKRDKIGLVVVDYLQLMTTGKRTENRVQEISEITRNLKITAKELNVPIIVLSQLSRSVEKNGSSSRTPMTRAAPTTPAATSTMPLSCPIVNAFNRDMPSRLSGTLTAVPSGKFWSPIPNASIQAAPSVAPSSP